jgi:CRP-like cAMP-binding protein
MEVRAPNLLIEALPIALRKALLARLRPVSLPLWTVLYEPDEAPEYAHFLTSGIASVVTPMSNGSSAEVCIWGKEGLVESFHLLGNAEIPTRAFIQMDSSALRMPFKELQKMFLENSDLREILLQCVQKQVSIVAQLAACNRLHEANERLARWLLMVRDRVDNENFYLTHEFLATMLGARRTTVSSAAGALQRSGLIQYSRGRIRILDSAALERQACECYKTVKNIYLGFYSKPYSA